MAVFAAPAQADLSVTGAVLPATGFPSFYEDGSGTQLSLCIDDPKCPASPPAGDFKAPDGEAFYQLASATATGPGGEEVTVDFNVEAAFLDNDPITFGRIQVTLKGLEPNGVYTVQHPYGTGTWTAGPNGDLVGGARAAQRDEVGCAAGPCDFTAAQGTAIGPFLHWDPAVAPAAPDGYIGDGVQPHAVVGSPTGDNFIRVTGPGLPAAVTDPLTGAVIGGGISTNEFTIEGRIASPPSAIFFAAPDSGAFGTQRVATTATRTVSVRNQGLAPMAVSGAAVSGAGEFAKGADSCTGQTIASGGACTVAVRFSPAAAGARAANLVVTEGGTSHSIALTGTGGEPGVAMSPAIVNFFNQNVSTTGGEQLLAVRNTGAVSLTVSGNSISGPQAGEFAKSSDTCTGVAVAPGATCTIGMRFLPAASGVRNASLTITSDAPGGARVVPLTGNGTVPPGTVTGPVSGTPAPSGLGSAAPPQVIREIVTVTQPAPAASSAAAPATAQKPASTQQPTAAAATPAPKKTAAPVQVLLRIGSLKAPRTIRLAQARKGVKVTMVLPKGATRLTGTLARSGKTVKKISVAHKAGRMTLTLKLTRRGSYKLSLKATGKAAGATSSLSFRIT